MTAYVTLIINVFVHGLVGLANQRQSLCLGFHRALFIDSWRLPKVKSITHKTSWCTRTYDNYRVCCLLYMHELDWSNDSFHRQYFYQYLSTHFIILCATRCTCRPSALLANVICSRLCSFERGREKERDVCNCRQSICNIWKSVIFLTFMSWRASRSIIIWPNVVAYYKGFGAPGGRKSLSPIDWRYRPYNSVRTNVLHCDLIHTVDLLRYLTRHVEWIQLQNNIAIFKLENDEFCCVRCIGLRKTAI